MSLLKNIELHQQNLSATCSNCNFQLSFSLPTSFKSSQFCLVFLDIVVLVLNSSLTVIPETDYWRVELLTTYILMVITFTLQFRDWFYISVFLFENHSYHLNYCHQQTWNLKVIMPEWRSYMQKQKCRS